MPALAPVDRPLPPLSWEGAVDRPVFAGRLVMDEDADGVGALKVSEVTLKQGTCRVKSWGSTKVCGWGLA